MNVNNSAWGVQGRHIGKSPIKDCPQPDPPCGHAVQFPVTVLAYYGPGNPATGAGGSGIVSRDASGQYWCDGKRFSHIQLALDWADAHHA